MNNILQTALNNVRRDYWLLAVALRAVNDAPTGPAEEETNQVMQAMAQYKKTLRHLHELAGQYPTTEQDGVELELCELEPLPLTGLIMRALVA